MGTRQLLPMTLIWGEGSFLFLNTQKKPKHTSTAQNCDWQGQTIESRSSYCRKTCKLLSQQAFIDSRRHLLTTERPHFNWWTVIYSLALSDREPIPTLSAILRAWWMADPDLDPRPHSRHIPYPRPQFGLMSTAVPIPNIAPGASFTNE